MYKGIDISQHNGYVDMSKVSGAGIDFVLVRDGYGNILSYPSQKDPTFERNYTNARAAGLGVGAYHYLYATTAAGAKREAEGFLATIKGKKFDYPVALDIEERAQYNLSNATVESIVKAFIDACEKAGYYTMLYSYEAFLTAKMSASFRANYDIWCANISYAPSIPYGIWQYSFTGSVDGCPSAVDLDKTSKDYVKIIKNGGFNGYPKPATKPLDTEGFKRGDKTLGVYFLKQRLKALGFTKLDDTNGFGGGTENAVNKLLESNGYQPNGIAGKHFADIFMR